MTLYRAHSQNPGRGWLSWSGLWFATYNIQDLLQGQAELEGDRLALLQHRPLQLLIVCHQVIE